MGAMQFNPMDPEFLAEITSRGGSVEFFAGDQTQALIENIYRTPPEILSKAREIRTLP